MSWILDRLKEPTTWRGLVWVATACGVTLNPEIWQQITAVGMALAGLLGVLTKEKPANDKVSTAIPDNTIYGGMRNSEVLTGRGHSSVDADSKTGWNG